MSKALETLNQRAVLVRSTVIPFLRSNKRFEVSDEASRNLIESYSTMLQDLVAAAQAVEESSERGQWKYLDGAAKDAASTIITTWAELTAPQMNDGNLGNQDKNLVARIDEKIIELQHATVELDHFLNMELMNIVTPASL